MSRPYTYDLTPPRSAREMVAGWVGRAACVGTDLDMWFDPERADEALKVCQDCPVSERCLTDAMKRKAADGIVGATTPPQRRRLARKMGIRAWPKASPPYEDGLPLCLVDDCERVAVTKGMCHTHYDRFRRHGTTELQVRRRLSEEEEAAALEKAGQIAGGYGCGIEQVLSDSRLREIVVARQAVMCGLREDGLSFSAIGRLLGRDHTTVMWAVKKHREVAA